MQDNSIGSTVLRRKSIVPSPSASGWGVLKRSPGLKRLAGDSLWVGIGQVGVVLGTLVGMRILTSFVPPTTFGSISLLIGCVTLAMSTFCQPYLQAMLRFYPEARSAGQVWRLRRIISLNLRWSVGVIGGVALIGGVIAARELGISYFTIAALGVLLAVEGRRSLELTMLSATRCHRLYALWQSLDSWMRPFLAIVAVLIWGPKPEAVFAGYALGSWSILILFHGVVKREGIDKEAKEEDGTQLRSKVRRYAVPLIPLTILGWISAVGDRYIIGGMLGLEAVGIYVAGYSIINKAFVMMGASVELILRQVYYEAVNAGDGERARKIFGGWLAITGMGGVIGIVVVVLFKERICRLLLAESYWDCARLMPWIASGYAILIVSYVFEKICYAHQRTGWVTLSQLIGAAASILVAIPLIALYGLDGAAMAVPAYFAAQLAAVLVGCLRVRAGR